LRVNLKWGSHPTSSSGQPLTGCHLVDQAVRITLANRTVTVGAGALHATQEVIEISDRLSAGAAKALLGKAALPDALPWVTDR